MIKFGVSSFVNKYVFNGKYIEMQQKHELNMDCNNANIDDIEIIDDDSNNDSNMCRYCYININSKDNYSTCKCKTGLCKECLINELKLTESQNNNILSCTVCKTKYDIEYTNNVNHKTRKCLIFSILTTLFCFSIELQGNRIPDIKERFALYFLFFFLFIWTSATTYSIMEPGINNFNGLTPTLLVYLFLISMDSIVSLSMLWFVHAIECLQMSIAFILFTIHFSRLFVVLYLKTMVQHNQDFWKIFGAGILSGTSGIIILRTIYMWLKTFKKAFPRYLLRNTHVLIGGKGPFKVNIHESFNNDIQIMDMDNPDLMYPDN